MLINPVTDSSASKENILLYVRGEIARLGFPIVEESVKKPWGAGFRFSEKIIPRFVELFFKDDRVNISPNLMLSPKFLIIAPHARLSWQYHHRRAEVWKVIGGEIGVILSDTDKETLLEIHAVGELININQGQRHRLVGLNCWGYVAEIWQHTDPDNPSNEEDIVRISDDYGRARTIVSI